MKKIVVFIALFLSLAINAQDSDNTVTLTVSGTGKTIEEAKNNALRSAIEQAFGAFISSKTEILNDNLIKDEVVSVTNGNIEKYDIISQIEIPNNGYAMTLSATVSISKLTSFAESKGVIVEFKGGMFAANIKLQKLNEQSEEKAIKNLIEIYFQLLENSFDYTLTTSEPLLVEGETDLYQINFNINTVENDNYNKFINFFKETISKVQPIDDEASNFIKVGKPIYYFIVDNELYKFRSINSFHNLEKFFISSQLLATSFRVSSNLGNYKYSFKKIFRDFRNFDRQDNINNNVLLDSRIIIGRNDYVTGFKLKEFKFNELNYFKYYNENWQYSKHLASLFPFFIKYKSQYKSLSDFYDNQISSIHLCNYDIDICSKVNSDIIKKYYRSTYGPINIDDTLFFGTTFNKATYSYSMNIKLNDLEKISSFKIDKVPFLQYMNNLSNYVEL